MPTIILVFYNFVILIVMIQACPPSLSSLNLPPPVIHTECLTRNSCRRGYICRLNRCVGGALASRTKYLDEDGSMELCCAENGLEDRCMGYCSMKSYSEEMVFKMMGECPMDSLQVIHTCATGNKDHRECCEAKRIPPSCVDLCSPDAILDQSKLHCLPYLSLMKSCFQ